MYVADQNILEFGETVRKIKALRTFIKDNGNDEINADYRDGIKSLNEESAKEGPVSDMQRLKNEITVQSWIYRDPHQSLTSQFGFHPLLQSFKENGLLKMADGAKDVQIAEPTPATTWKNIAVKGWAEAAQNMWAAQTYRLEGFKDYAANMVKNALTGNSNPASSRESVPSF